MDLANEEFLLFLKCADQAGLRYLCIGGFAVNYYGYHRNTEDLDIWIAPTIANKDLFLKTLDCMGYSKSEIDYIRNEDFTTHFICSLGAPPFSIDVLTIVHKNISFDDAEKNGEIHTIEGGEIMRMVPYEFLKSIKLLAGREKDLWDVARLDEMIQKRKKL